MYYRGNATVKKHILIRRGVGEEIDTTGMASNAYCLCTLFKCTSHWTEMYNVHCTIHIQAYYRQPIKTNEKGIGVNALCLTIIWPYVISWILDTEKSGEVNVKLVKRYWNCWARKIWLYVVEFSFYTIDGFTFSPHDLFFFTGKYGRISIKKWERIKMYT